MLERELRHYTTRLRHSQRLRYRIARTLAVWLPVFVVFVIAMIVVAGAHL